MSDEQLSSKLECQDLLFRFGAALDRGANADAADLFAEGARLGAPDGTFAEGDAVREALMKRPSTLVTRHLVTNLVVTPTGPDTADGIAYVMNYRVMSEDRDNTPHPLPESPGGVGEWRLAFRKTAAGWRLSSLETVPVFVAS